jgi:hypothetical protein
MISQMKCEVTLARQIDLDSPMDAWRHSRPNETNPTLASVLAVDAPVNEFPRVQVVMTVPILIREIIFTLRDHTAWARTSRVDDLEHWHVWRNTRNVEALQRQMLDAREAGEHQDKFRMLLPLSYMTSFTLDLSLRTYVKLIGYFERLANDMRPQLDEVVSLLFSEVAAQMRLALPWPCQGLRYKPIQVCQRPHQYTPSGFYGSFVVISAIVPIALRAQIVRHRMFQIADDLENFFSAEGLDRPISNPLMMQLSCSLDTAREISAKRSCWIAQTDLWKVIVEKMQDATGKVSLPCDDGSCPYARDNRLRIEGRDPGPPCPRYATLHREPLTDAQKAAAHSYLADRPSPDFWRKEIDK